MTSTLIPRPVAALAAAAAVLVGGIAFQAHLVAASQAGRQLEGTWITSSDARGGNAFVTFTADGSLVLTSRTLLAVDSETGRARFTSPGHGVWAKTGDGEFSAVWWHNRFDAETASFLGTTRVSCVIRLNAAADEYACQQQVDFLDPAGAFERSLTAATPGKRMKLEPLP